MEWINKKEFGKFKVEQLKREDGKEEEKILLLSMSDGENRFNPTNLKNINAALDYIESLQSVSCLITTSTDVKYYSLGLDLDYCSKFKGKSTFLNLLYDLGVMLERVLVFPIPTISCIQGHAFAGGAIFSMVHDYSVMKSNRGFICVNAIDNEIPLPPGLISILKLKITDSKIYRDFVLQGKRYGGVEAEKLGLVDYHHDQPLEQSIKLAIEIGKKDKLTYGCLKIESYRNESLKLLDKDLGESLKLKMFDQQPPTKD